VFANVDGERVTDRRANKVSLAYRRRTATGDEFLGKNVCFPAWSSRAGSPPTTTPPSA
jgi:hypothetical protein